jgi:hypothetical protein
MSLLDVLRELSFGQRVAEEEGQELAQCFVETDHWFRLLNDEADIVYGPKGSGKSALYSLLVQRADPLFDRQVLLAPAENPRGAPAFRDLAVDPPASEREFVGLWKLYLLCVLSDVLDEYGAASTSARQVREALTREGLTRARRDLRGILRAVGEYIRHAFRPQAVEANVQLDPHTGLPVGFGGKITFEAPDAVGTREGAISVDELLALCNDALGEQGYAVWLLLDRLDVAFAESPELEHNALRALFRVYLDLLGLPHVRLKIFLRSDIWRRITREGFREASHITRDMTIEWDGRSLMHLIILRAVRNTSLLHHYGVEREGVLNSPDTQLGFFYRMCPDQVDIGSRKPSTFDWVLTRTCDGTGQNAPREVIHLLNCLRGEQVRRLEIGEGEPEGGYLFAVRPSRMRSSRCHEPGWRRLCMQRTRALEKGWRRSEARKPPKPPRLSLRSGESVRTMP